MGNCSAAPVEPTTSPSTVRTARTVDTTDRTAPLKREPSKFQLVHSTSLRGTLSPPKSPSTQVARYTSAYLFILEDQFTLLQQSLISSWMLPDIDWEMAMDENGNTYFYNNSTGETSWSPPPSLMHLNLPTKNLSIKISVPEEAVPGKSFIADVEGQAVEIMCPAFCNPGDELEILCPDDELLQDGEDKGNLSLLLYIIRAQPLHVLIFIFGVFTLKAFKNTKQPPRLV